MDLGANGRKLTLGALAISSLLLAGGAVPTAAQSGPSPAEVRAIAKEAYRYR